MKTFLMGIKRRLFLSVRPQALMLVLIPVLTGCAGFSEQPRRVLLKHPETMEFVSCEVGIWTTQAEYDKKDDCVAGYQKQGYVIWGER